MSGTVLTGLLTVNGRRVALCYHACDTGHQRVCGRPEQHPADDYGHICPTCVGVWADTGERP